MRNGVTSATFQSIMIGPGAIYKGFISPASPGTLIGATLGGNSISIEREFHAPELDGMLGPVKGTQRIIKEIPKLVAKIAETNKDTLMLALAGTSSTLSATNWNKITSNGAVSAGNYQDIAIVGDVMGKANPIVFVVKNAISTEPVEIGLGSGKDDTAFQVTFTGNYDPANPTVAPYELYDPVN